MPVRKIKIVKNGTLTVEAFEEPSLKDISLKNLCGIGGNSSVVFIESDAKILVDTGFEEDLSVEMNENLLINDLKRFGIKPEDIDAVFITPLAFGSLWKFARFQGKRDHYVENSCGEIKSRF